MLIQSCKKLVFFIPRNVFNHLNGEKLLQNQVSQCIISSYQINYSGLSKQDKYDTVVKDDIVHIQNITMLNKCWDKSYYIEKLFYRLIHL